MDFDAWRLLASTDPEAFEAERRKVLQAVIERAPARRRQRLEGLQWRVDQVRRRSASPMAACISLSDMMWEAFAGKRGLLATLRGRNPGAAGGGAGDAEPPSAKVLRLKKPGRDRP
jgi:hypothetical protein